MLVNIIIHEPTPPPNISEIVIGNGVSMIINRTFTYGDVMLTVSVLLLTIVVLLFSIVLISKQWLR